MGIFFTTPGIARAALQTGLAICLKGTYNPLHHTREAKLGFVMRLWRLQNLTGGMGVIPRL